MVFSASGIGQTVNPNGLNQTKTTDYVGNKIYENGTLSKILFENGYYSNGIYYFYLRDHLGNTRKVMNKNLNQIESTDYMPFGVAFSKPTLPYNFNGKELDIMHGLNMYDYSARYMDPAYGRFTTMDPLCEKHCSESPYAYCGNNPIVYYDPDGKEKLNGLYDPKCSKAEYYDPLNVEVRRKMDNNLIHIYAHGIGTPATSFTYYGRDGYTKKVTNTEDLISLLNAKSAIWQNRKSDEEIIVVLHSCRTGQKSKNSPSFAAKISKDFKGIIIAPGEQIEMTIYGETILRNGRWNYFKNGKLFDSEQGIPENNPDLKKMSLDIKSFFNDYEDKEKDEMQRKFDYWLEMFQLQTEIMRNFMNRR